MIWIPTSTARLGSCFLLLFLATCASSSSLLYECPEPEDIYPCYCEEEDGDPILFCNHLQQPRQISDALSGLRGHRVHRVSFFMNWIVDPVDADAFKDSSAQRVVIENSTIQLKSPQFQGLENHLEGLQLRACFNKTNPLGTWSLGHLSKLTELVLDKNRILKLPDGWLSSAPDSLRSLTLEDNSIVTLGDEAFAGVKRLTFMVLDGNRLIELKRSAFPRPALALRSLSLNSNRLRYLANDLFSEMPNLRIVEMINNRLTELEEKIWSGAFFQITKLDVSENPLECDGALKWITTGGSKPILFYGQCQSPDTLKDKPLKELKPSDFS